MSRARSALLAVVVGGLFSGVLTGCTGGGSGGSGGTDPGFVSGDGKITVVAPADRKPAPAVQGPRLGTDGQTVDSADYPGKVVVINIWGSWCNPCRAEAPDLEAASRQTAARAQFIGLNTKDFDPAPAAAFVRAFGVTYPQIYDPRGTALVSLAGDLPPNAIPTTVVIDARNRIAARVAGTVTKLTLVGLIDDIAAGR